MISYSPLLCLDFYKTAHAEQYPATLTKMVSYYTPKAVYVFSKRVNPLRNGLEVDENGKPWSSTMCFAWFVWEHGYTGEPCIRWI